MSRRWKAGYQAAISYMLIAAEVTDLGLALSDYFKWGPLPSGIYCGIKSLLMSKPRCKPGLSYHKLPLIEIKKNKIVGLIPKGEKYN